MKKYNRTVTPLKTIVVTSTELDKYLGVYASKDISLKITITKKGNVLVAQATGQSSFELAATAKDRFEYQDGGIVLDFDAEKRSMILKQGGKQFSFTRE